MATHQAPLRPVRRALISVSDKTGLVEFGQALAARGVELVSTGGTAKALREAGLEVADVSDITQFPEMMDGRVKTLHPGVHGGLLFMRGNAEHEEAANKHNIMPIDLLAVNLYPFEETIAAQERDGGADYETAIENIDLAIAEVSKRRGALGATQNRLESTINNLQVTSENLAASESRIRDTDMATEMVNFTKNQILQQAGTAMLGQANSIPQSVLRLLG